jgi:hypothetical protein
VCPLPSCDLIYARRLGCWHLVLLIPQWIYGDAVDPGHAATTNTPMYNWFQSRARDIFNAIKQYGGASTNYVYWDDSVIPSAWAFNKPNGIVSNIVYDMCTCSTSATCQHNP